jgi:hypothetical protein
MAETKNEGLTPIVRLKNEGLTPIVRTPIVRRRATPTPDVLTPIPDVQKGRPDPYRPHVTPTVPTRRAKRKA